MNLQKNEKENDKQYIYRICKMKDELGYTWKEIADVLNNELGNEFTESAYRKQYQIYNTMFEANGCATTDEYLKEIQEQKDELYKIKKQVQDQRREYHKLLTADARAEHLNEKLIEVANRLAEEKPLDFSGGLIWTDNNEAVLCISDIHYGMTANNIWNVYNTNIAKQRMKNLVNKAKKYLMVHEVDTLHILLLGDQANGSIHSTCRIASEEDACDQLMHVSELVAEAIYELSATVNSVKVYSTYGNHMRTVQNKNDSIHSDNMEKLLPFWLKQRFRDNDKIEIIDSEYYEFIHLNVCGHEVIATHGDLDGIKSGMTLTTLFMKACGIMPEYIILADKHHVEEFEQLGVDTTIVGSFCGTDEYANNKRLYSYPTQALMIFNEGEGKLCQYNIRLDK